MRWTAYRLKDGSYAQSTIASDAGYAICRTRASLSGVVGSAAPLRYLAFKCFSNNAPPLVLGGYDTSEEAKAACEAHKVKSSEVVVA